MTGWSYTSRKKNVGTWKQFLWTASSFLTLGSNFYLPAKQPAVLFAGSQRLTRDGFTLSPIPLVEKKKKGKEKVGLAPSGIRTRRSREASVARRHVSAAVFMRRRAVSRLARGGGAAWGPPPLQACLEVCSGGWGGWLYVCALIWRTFVNVRH